MSNGLWIGDAYAHGPGECEPEYASLWDGLVGCWVPQMGPTGNRLVDLSGYANHGTLTNMDPATDWVPGPNGWALDFDGSDDFVSCGKAFGNRSELSIAAQVRFSALPANAAIASQFGKMNRIGDWLLMMDIIGETGANVFTWVIKSGPDWMRWPWCESSPNSAALHTWYSIVATWKSGSGMGLYVNGVNAKAFERNATYPSTVDNAFDYMIGDTTVRDKPLRGQISYQMTWNRYFSDAEATLQMADPLCFLRPRRRWWAVAPAAAGVYRVRRYHDRLFAPGLSPGVM